MNNNQELIDGLREMADFLEERPDFGAVGVPSFLCYMADKESFVEHCRQLGSYAKHVDDGGKWIEAHKRFGPIDFQVYTARENICERLVTEVEVPEEVIPAIPATVIAAHTETKVE